MTPAQLIAALDRSLLKAGTPAVLSRTVNGVTATANVRVKPVATPLTEVVGGVMAPGANIVMSPSDLTASSATWPGTLAPKDGLDLILPRKNDSITIVGEGRVRTVQDAKPIYINGTMVRIDVTSK